MRRKNKCANKKPYNTKSKALEAAKRSYLLRGVKTNYYECAVCLDFHLTSKHQLPESYYKKWQEEKNTPPEKRKKQDTVAKLKKKIGRQYNMFLQIEAAILKRIEKGQPIAKPKQNYKKTILPLVEQRRIIREMQLFGLTGQK